MEVRKKASRMSLDELDAELIEVHAKIEAIIQSKGSRFRDKFWSGTPKKEEDYYTVGEASDLAVLRNRRYLLETWIKKIVSSSNDREKQKAEAKRLLRVKEEMALWESLKPGSRVKIGVTTREVTTVKGCRVLTGELWWKPSELGFHRDTCAEIRRKYNDRRR